jgi:hypothetical protein
MTLMTIDNARFHPLFVSFIVHLTVRLNPMYVKECSLLAVGSHNACVSGSTRSSYH